MTDISSDLPPLGHLGYIVTDLAASVEGFRRLMGIHAFRVYDYEPLRAWADGRELRPCRLRIAIGSLRDRTKIELIQPLEGDTPQARFLREKGPGLHHLAFYSASYDQWRERFAAQGAAILFEAEVEDAVNGYRRSFYAQASGAAAVVEISEIARKRK